LAWAGIEQVVLDAPGRRAFWSAWSEQQRLPSDTIQRTWQLDADGLAPWQLSDLDVLFKANERARILCLTRGQDTGAERINAQLHDLHAQRVQAKAPILVGEPVMMLHNDYDRMLFNGDQGLVLWVEEAGGRRPMAVFARAGGGYRAFHLDALGNRITLCHAMTVHKSQGSEFETVAVVLPDDDLPLLSRALLYTAVTRSKRSVVVVGTPAMLHAGIDRADTRRSGLAALLA
jgi:exodeoxyribonuclease V alpha subunit